MDLIAYDEDEISLQTIDSTSRILDLKRRIKSKMFKKRRLGRVLFNLGNDFKIAVGFFCMFNKAKKPYGVYVDARSNQILKSTSTTKYICKDTA